MLAMVYEHYGPPEVLQLKELTKPTPKANEILVKVCATTVTRGDTRMRSFTVPAREWLFARLYLGIRRPRRPILGMELAGEVEAVGSQVTRFRPGQRIIASTFSVGFGGYVEYKCFPETAVIAAMPANVTFEEAAALCGGGMTALRCVRAMNLRQGQQMLIYGASGAVGTNAVQLARHMGAQVTAVCSSANLALLRSLGATQVIDYTQTDLHTLAAAYDVIFDAVGKLPAPLIKPLLKPDGRFFDVHRISGGRESVADLQFLVGLVESGALKVAIDRCYPFEQLVAAHHYVDQGHKKGNVVISVARTANSYPLTA